MYIKNTQTFLIGKNIIAYHISIFDIEKVSKSGLDNNNKNIKYKNLIPPIINDDSKTHILFLHESITGTLLPNNTKINNDCIFNINDINQFNYVLLGDIHTTNNIIYNKPHSKIAYPGSLIQQDFGESSGDHGLFSWNIINNTYKFHIINNDYGFKTIILSDLTDLSSEIFPLNTTLQILTTPEYDTNKVTIALNKIKSLTNIIDYFGHSFIIDHNNSIKFCDNINNNSHFDEYIDNITHYPLSSKRKIKNLHEQFNKYNHVHHDNRIWKIIKLSLHNIFCFDDFELDFEKYNSHGNYGSLIGIFGPNGSGKSSIANAIIYCIYGFKGLCMTLGDIHNKSKKNKKDTNMAELSFKINDTLYKIQRLTNKPNYAHDKYNKVFLFKFIIDKFINISSVNKDETQKIITSLFGDKFFLLNSNISRQGQYDIVINGTNNNILKLLKKFLSLSTLDDINIILNNYIKNINVDIKNYKKKIIDINKIVQSLNFDNINNNILSCKQKINNYEEHIQSLKSDIISYNTYLSSHDIYYNNVDKLNSDIINIQHNIDSKKLCISNNYPLDLSIKKEFDVLTHKRDDYISKKDRFMSLFKSKLIIPNNINIDSISSDIKSLKNKIISIKFKESSLVIKKNKKKYEKLFNSFQLKKKELSLLNKEIIFYQTMDKYVYDPNCSFCSTNKITNTNPQHIIKQNDLNKQLHKLNTFIIKNKSCEKLFSQYDKLFKQNIIKQNLRQQLIEVKLLFYYYHINLFNKKLETLQKHLDILNQNSLIKNNIDDEINKLTLQLNTLLNSKKLFVSLHLTKNKINKFNEQLLEYSVKLSECKKDLSVYNEKLDSFYKNRMELNRNNINLELLINKLNIHKLYKHEISIKGFQQHLLRQKIDLFVNEINIFLNNIVDYKINIDFVLKEKDVNAKVYFYKVFNNNKYSIQTIAGFETFIISIAFRLSLHNICDYICFPNFFIIDEGFGTFDNKHISEVNKIFEFLKRKYQFTIIISHIDEIKNSVDKFITLS